MTRRRFTASEFDQALDERRHPNMVLLATPDAALAKEISEFLNFNGATAVAQLDAARTVESATRWRAEVVVVDARCVSESRYLFDEVKRLRMLSTIPAVILLRDKKPSRDFVTACEQYGVYNIAYADGAAKSVMEMAAIAWKSRRAGGSFWQRSALQ